MKTSIGAFVLTTMSPINIWGSAKKPHLLQVFNNETTVKAIGQKYLLQFPKEKEQLNELLAGINDMKKRSTDEFRSANYVTIDGWVLAQSEARECAQYYLKTSGHAY